jgi:hypothetical protein
MERKGRPRSLRLEEAGPLVGHNDRRDLVVVVGREVPCTRNLSACGPHLYVAADEMG